MIAIDASDYLAWNSSLLSQREYSRAYYIFLSLSH